MKQTKNLIEHVLDILKQSSFSARNKVGAFLAALTVLTGATNMPISAFGVVPGDALSFGQNIEIDVKTATTITYPVPQAIGVSQGYFAFHPGVDIRAPIGSPIYPIEQGKVSYVGSQRGGYGRHVIVEHENGKTSLYAHMNKIDVYEGDTVDTNTKLGGIGMTGYTTGPHLHLEVRINGRTTNPVTELGKLSGK